jgi:hypothetical protein
MDRSTRQEPKSASSPARDSSMGSSVASGPLGKKVIRMDGSSGRARASQSIPGNAQGGARGLGEATDNRKVGVIPPVRFEQNLAGQTFDFKSYFSNPRQNTASTWLSTSAPAGMTLNSTTGVLSGTPTTVASGTPNLTVVSAKGAADPSIVTPWSWTVYA